MSPRVAAQSALLALAVCLVDATGADRVQKTTQGNETPINVVFLLTDDQRHDALGAAGNPTVKTPNLDRLAAGGVRFANAFCTTSICPSSRASFLTGQYASRHGIEDFATALSEAQRSQSWHGVLRQRGYQSAFIGKWGLGGEQPDLHFDYWRGFAGQGRYLPGESRPGSDESSQTPGYLDAGQTGHLTRRLGQQAIDFIRSDQLAEPFLLQLSFKAPHAQDGAAPPFQYDPIYRQLYAGAEMPLPASATEAAFAALPEMLQTSEGRKRWHQRFATAEQFQESVKGYYRLVAGVDDVVGRIREALEQSGVADRTVIVFSSDNGFLLGEHGLAGKWLMYEESIRIPLIIFDPRLPASRRGGVVDEMVLNIDLAPTILELAAAPVPKRMQGRSLRTLLLGERARWRSEFYYEHRFAHPLIPVAEGVRTGRWKLVRYSTADDVVEQLFDLREDPMELSDLSRVGKHARRLESLRRQLSRLRAGAR